MNNLPAYLKKNAPVVLIVVIAVVSLLLIKNKQWLGSDKGGTNICSDGRGYYAWLPAIFIYHDLNFGFGDSVEGLQPDGCLQDYRTLINGRKTDTYYPATVFCQLPFFLVAHLYCKITGTHDANGYTVPYAIMVGVGAYVIMLFGLWYFEKVLRSLGFNTTVRTLTILFMFTGSNLITYSIDAPAYSHICSFALVVLFISFTLDFARSYRVKFLLALAFLGGWIVAGRAVNAPALLFFPAVLWPDRKNALLWFRQHLLTLFPAALLFAVMPVLTVTLYYLSTGSLVLYSYPVKVFDFVKPHTISFLFSQTNGLVPYLPLLFFALILVPMYYRQHLWITGASFFIIALAIYIHSAWWCWWYGYSFGSRTLLDFLGFFGLLIAYSLNTGRKNVRAGLVILYSLCSVLTMILYHQRHHGFLGGNFITDYPDALLDFFGIK